MSKFLEQIFGPLADAYNQTVNSVGTYEKRGQNIRTDDLPDHVKKAVDSLAAMRRHNNDPNIQGLINALYDPETRDAAYYSYQNWSKDRDLRVFGNSAIADRINPGGVDFPPQRR